MSQIWFQSVIATLFTLATLSLWPAASAFSAVRLLGGVDDGLIGKWTPGFGDPTLLGWVITLTYVAGGLQAWRVVGRTPTHLADARLERALWAILAAALFALGLNKQLDLQTALTEIGRAAAQDGGFYDDRRSVQRYFVVVVGLAAIVGAVVLFRFARRASFELRLAVIGTALILAFIVARAAAFHHVAAPGSGTDAEDPVSLIEHLIELAGVLVVLVSARRRSTVLGKLTAPRTVSVRPRGSGRR